MVCRDEETIFYENYKNFNESTLLKVIANLDFVLGSRAPHVMIVLQIDI